MYSVGGTCIPNWKVRALEIYVAARFASLNTGPVLGKGSGDSTRHFLNDFSR